MSVLLKEIATLDAVLNTHARRLSGDFTAYRNHAYRVANLCAALCHADTEQLEKIAVAAAFHDLGIWTDSTFDYLPPSIHLACAHVAHANKAEWIPEVSGMILEHHKLSRYRDDPTSLIEPFRCADWLDVSRGLWTFGLPRSFVREVFSAWPDAGFHQRLLQLALERLRTHPGSPLPMLRL